MTQHLTIEAIDHSVAEIAREIHRMLALVALRLERLRPALA